jgi:NAD(P)-dependent dehydrogenase (short-subunit alcohol dehydrogenase family)
LSSERKSPSDAHVTDVTPFPNLNRPSYSEIREQNMSLKDKTVVVTGGSRGLGLGLVEALVDQGAKVTVVARGADALGSVSARLGVATIAADVADETAAHRIIAEVRRTTESTAGCPGRNRVIGGLTRGGVDRAVHNPADNGFIRRFHQEWAVPIDDILLSARNLMVKSLILLYIVS